MRKRRNGEITEVAPDGVTVVIDWKRFSPGASIFIPAIDTERTVRHVLKIGKLEKSQIKYRVTIENEKYGVRIWRLV